MNDLIAEAAPWEAPSLGSAAFGAVPVVGSAGAGIADVVGSGDWAGGLHGLVGATTEAVGVLVNPLGALASSVASFLLDRFEPFQRLLDELVGNNAEVEAAATTFGNVNDELHSIGSDLRTASQDSATSWTGEAGDAFREHVSARLEDLSQIQAGIPGVVTGLLLSSAVVSAVRQIVHDLVSDLVGKIISWVAKAVYTFGLGTPVIAADAAITIKKWLSRAQEYVTALLDSMGRLSDLLTSLAEFYQENKGVLKAIDDHILSSAAPAVTTAIAESSAMADSVANR